MPPKSRQKAVKASKASGWDTVRVGNSSDAPDAQTTQPLKEERLPLKPHWPSRSTAAAALGLLAYGARNALRIPKDSLDSWAGQPLLKAYTGMEPIDGLFARLVSAFSYPLSGKDPESRIQLMYLAPMLGATALVWTIEGWKRDHRPSTFMAAYQIFGIGLVAPLYFALSILSDKGDVLNVSLPKDIAQAVFPGVLLGFFIPTYLMFIDHSDAHLHQRVTALWQPSPVYAAVLTTFIAAFIRRASLGRESRKFNQAKVAQHSTGDPLPSLRLAYGLTSLILAAVHVYILATAVSSNMSLYDVFLNLPHPFAEWDIKNPYYAMAIFMKFDLLFYTLSVVVYLLYCAVDLTMLGCVDAAQAGQAALGILLGPLVVGPGATYVGFWWYREEVLAANA